MALVIKDRVKETTTTTGTGTYTLAGAETGFQAFSVIGDGNTTYYAVTDNTDWEVGIGTYTATGTTLARTTILSSSNSDNAVDWGAGTKYIFVTQPSSKANYLDADGYVTGTEVKTHIDFNTTTSNKPSHAEGRLFYDKANGALGFYNNESDITLQIGQEDYTRVYNNSGSTIANGTPVYVTGEANDFPTVSPAKASGTIEQSRAIGFATHSIENNTFGFVTVRGLVGDIDTSHLTVGEPVHVGTTVGTTQTLSPTYPNFPTEVGICLISHATNGCVYAQVHYESFESLRVTGNVHFDENLTIDGDLTVLGTQTIASSSNIALTGALQYLNSGDTIGDSNTTFTGTGLDDATLVGHYEGTTSNRGFYVEIDGTGTPDTFKWSHNSDLSSPEATGVSITGAEQSLAEGISVEFNATTGHTSGDKWGGTASPVNADTGVISNRNTGGSGVGYTYVGMYYDVSSGYWTFFDELDSEPSGAVNVSDSSFSYGTIKADTVIASLTGNVTGNLTGSVSGNVTGNLIGDVTGSVTDTGTSNFGTVDFGAWTITESSGNLIFQYNGATKFKLDSTGTLSVTNDVQTDQSL